MRRWTLRVVLTAVAAVGLAFVLAMLMVNAADAAPQQANVPLFTYGSI